MSLRTLSALAILALCVATPCAQSRPATAWGPPTSGLQLGVAALTTDDAGGGVAFEVSFKNSGASDFVLNLGYMLANGKVMFPQAVRLALTRPAGTTCELTYFDRRYPGIAGRVDDFIVALPPGAAYTLRLTGDRLWCAADEQPQTGLPPGPYRVKARLEARGAVTGNLDMKGVALLNFWHGKAESAQTSFDLGR